MKAGIKETGERIEVECHVHSGDIFNATELPFRQFHKNELDFDYNETIKTDNSKVNVNLLEENKKLKSQVAELTSSVAWAACELVKKNDIDWEQRRFEIAVNIMPSYVSGGSYSEKAEYRERQVRKALQCADELIKQLKNK